MQLSIASVDYAPEDLYDQVPLVVDLLRELPGPDRPDYWIGRLAKPVSWLADNQTTEISFVVLCARWEGTQIARGAEDLPVGIAYVTDESLLNDDQLTLEKCSYVAIGIARDAGGGAPIQKPRGILAGTIGRAFGVGNPD
ncbi:MAG TPA: hypothetical protein ENI85_10690 [Deltaproteobacteria bacterium]|nr:hypothetical protein [Deltaproteobacteria bacterium]